MFNQQQNVVEFNGLSLGLLRHGKDPESNPCRKTKVKLATGRSCEEIDLLFMEDGWVLLFAALFLLDNYYCL